MLRAKGARVELTSENASQPFFTVTGRIVNVNGEGVQVFEYPNAAMAEREAKLVSPSGSPVGTSMITWMAPPHFYRSGPVIALYVGSNGAVTKALEAALGPQFAGGR